MKTIAPNGIDHSDAEYSPEISVCIITYNQACYIEECVMSVLRQEHSLSMEIIIADDGSNDGAQEVLLELAKRYDLKLILSSENKGVKKNLHKALTNANGKYVALLEGDDYWVDKKKLEAQISRMRADEKIVLSYTSALMEVKMFGIRKAFREEAIDFKTRKDIKGKLWQGWFGFHTCTLVMTNAFVKQHLSSEFFNDRLTSGDWPIAMHGSTIGKIDYLDMYSACYRVAPGSIMNSGIESRFKLIKEWVEWWGIYRQQNVDGCLSAESIRQKAIIKLREIGFVPAYTKKPEEILPGLGSFRRSKLLSLVFIMKRQGYLLKRWLMGERLL